MFSVHISNFTGSDSVSGNFSLSLRKAFDSNNAHFVCLCNTAGTTELKAYLSLDFEVLKLKLPGKCLHAFYLSFKAIANEISASIFFEFQSQCQEMSALDFCFDNCSQYHCQVQMFFTTQFCSSILF